MTFNNTKELHNFQCKPGEANLWVFRAAISTWTLNSSNEDSYVAVDLNSFVGKRPFFGDKPILCELNGRDETFETHALNVLPWQR